MTNNLYVYLGDGDSVEPPRLEACRGCRHYCRNTLAKIEIVCGMHPQGAEGSDCPDYEEGSPYRNSVVLSTVRRETPIATALNDAATARMRDEEPWTLRRVLGDRLPWRTLSLLLFGMWP